MVLIKILLFNFYDDNISFSRLIEKNTLAQKGYQGCFFKKEKQKNFLLKSKLSESVFRYL